MSETDDQLARRLLGKVLDGSEPWTPDMRLRIATVSQAYVSLAILDELRTLNSDRSQWYREVLEVLTQAKEPEGSLRSGQPEAASWCQVCEVSSIHDGSAAVELTKEQWMRHLEAYYTELIPFGAGHEQALRMATGRTTTQFGPCPEES